MLLLVGMASLTTAAAPNGQWARTSFDYRHPSFMRNVMTLHETCSSYKNFASEIKRRPMQQEHCLQDVSVQP